MENSDALIRTSLREGEENADRLARTQLLMVPVLIVAMLTVPAFRIVYDDGDEGQSHGFWSAIGWLADRPDDAPGAYRLLTVAAVLAILFAVAAAAIGLYLAYSRSKHPGAEIGFSIVAGALPSVVGVIGVIALPEDSAVHMGWGVLLPAFIGLWLANMVRSEV
ncbi:hypothetical protein J2S40_004475 [Nocardioides luteus]|uniref:ABC transporter permease n=1 Tax=Nocardioides luteus TaxID=1844 RepID=A0ABQ5SSA5_9ACTN|nr:hypothetical protein [Nocardioides luteus]MDR7313417.1 hypothetical protein [Nocardioides luteus]GGR60771.1 hypothetical protein GCM10010197_29820 [Nocardioides luteus]GLJ66483.1 hypothetical protein GCM10017579_05190 [Nocardioides luteus]